MNSAAATAYAKAFLEAADREGKTAALLPLAASLGKSLSKLEKQLADPRHGPAARAKLAKDIATTLKLPPLLGNLLRLLAANKRLGEAGAVMHSIVTLAHARDGVADVKLESAQPLTEAQLADLKDVLKKKLNARDVLVVETTMPGLIGGFRAFTDGNVWDCSIKGRLSALAAKFNQIIHH